MPEEKKTGSQRRKIFAGRVSEARFWYLAVKPLPLYTFPAVVFSALVFGTYAAGLTLVALLQDAIFSAPPYNLTTSQIGLTNLPLFGVGLVGTLIAGFLADFVVGFMSRRNKLVYEPEFRLLLLILATSLGTVAYLGFGISVGAGANIVIPIAFLGLQTAAVPFSTSATFTYVMDCHPGFAAQAFVSMNLVKAIFSFGLSEVVNGLLTQLGAQKLFTLVAFVNLGVSALAIPMYIFGKRLRSKVCLTSISLALYSLTIPRLLAVLSIRNINFYHRITFFSNVIQNIIISRLHHRTYHPRSRSSFIILNHSHSSSPTNSLTNTLTHQPPHFHPTTLPTTKSKTQNNERVQDSMAQV
jgi:hypothetical protein